jgi:hypothetical protein
MRMMKERQKLNHMAKEEEENKSLAKAVSVN